MFLKFTYNAAGQRTSMVDQTGFTTNYTYDAVGRLSKLTDGSGNLIVTYTYDANGRLSEKTNGNGTYTTYQYDADGNVLHLINYAPGGTINSRFDYTYNALGLETTEATLDGTWTYTYDADGQLIHAVFASTNPSIPSQDLAYSYDAMGNRITTVINGVTTAYMTNDMNEYTSVGGVAYTYDADGNLISDGTNTYTYNSLNQMISVTGPSGTTTYTYNALGQQVASTTNGQTTQYLIDPTGLGNVVGEYAGNNSLIAEYTYGLELTSQVTASNSYYYDSDAIGSTVGISSAAGTYVNTYGYLPFGGTMSAMSVVANPFRFVGGYGVTSDTNGIEFMRSRYYQESDGRFITPDPLRSVLPWLKAYEYANNLPNVETDPTGLNPFSPSQNNTMVILGPILVPLGLVGGPVGWAATAGGSFLTGLGTFPSSEANNPELAAEIGDGLNGTLTPEEEENAIQEGNQSLNDYMQDPEFARAWNYYLNIPQDNSGSPSNENNADAVISFDPNAMLGPAGYGSSNFVTDAGTIFPYQIDFENAPSATAPAQAVTITDQLDPNLNWSTFRLTGIRWGDTILSIPAGSQHYEATVSMTYDGQAFDVLVEAGIHTSTGQVYATFQSINPDTMLPPDVLAGFLPPENGTGRGMGDISFMVQANAGLATGTQIRNVALITFDSNSPIATDQVNDEDPSQGVDPTKQALVTIDSVAPTSSVNPLPATTTTSSFTVNMSGIDDTGGSGVGSFALYVSTDGGPFVLDQSDIPAQAGSGATYTASITFAGAGQYLLVLQRGDRQRRQRRGGHRGRPGDDHGPAPVHLDCSLGCWNLCGHGRTDREPGLRDLVPGRQAGDVQPRQRRQYDERRVGHDERQRGRITQQCEPGRPHSRYGLRLRRGELCRRRDLRRHERKRQPGRGSGDADSHLVEPGRHRPGNAARFGTARRDRLRPGHLRLLTGRGDHTGRRTGTDPGGDIHSH